MAGFAETAAYFDARAKKARAEDRQRFLEAARFYRGLARITPTFPPGYKTPVPKQNGSRHADRWHDRAEECRAIAAHMNDQNCRATLERLADTYDGLVRTREA